MCYLNNLLVRLSRIGDLFVHIAKYADCQQRQLCCLYIVFVVLFVIMVFFFFIIIVFPRLYRDGTSILFIFYLANIL